jgi:hypothetical protein
MYHEMITADTLRDGTRLRYAKGLILGERQGHRVIRHDGSIYGFRSADRVYPDDSLSVVVLINTFGPVDPDEVATAIADAVLGLPPDRGQPFNGDLTQLTGTYQGPIAALLPVTLVVAENRLAMKSGAGEPRPLLYRGGDIFERGDTRLHFVRRGGRVVGIHYDIGYASTYLPRR